MLTCEKFDQLDGKKYASYEGRFEMPIIQQLIRDDGGEVCVIHTYIHAHTHNAHHSAVDS